MRISDWSSDVCSSDLQDDATIAEIRAALLAYKVVFFRDQFITAEQHIAFARRFGPLEIHPATPQDQANREVLHIAHGPESRGRENFWHSDVNWRAEPSLGSIPRAIVVPEVGGGEIGRAHARTPVTNVHIRFRPPSGKKNLQS